MRFFLKFIILSFLIVSCKNETINNDTNSISNKLKSDKFFISTMQKHLDAVTNRDLKKLKSTLSPNGEMQLILPGQEIIYTTAKFMEFHREWFKDTTWTFETKILNTDISNDFGMAITELTYREPERNGKPYFNRQIVSYDLKKINGKWCIIKDHCTSVEKTK